jgi:hypothetical protein
MVKWLVKRREKQLAKLSRRQQIYTTVAQEALLAARMMRRHDGFAEDFWMLYDISGILFTLSQLDESPEAHARLNVFLHQLRTLQLPIRDLHPPKPEPDQPSHIRLVKS